MEMEEIHTQVCKLARVGGVNNSRNESKAKLSGQRRGGGDNEDEEDGEDKGGGGGEDESNRLRACHSSRIFRVSRASGGKDRHSKVLTAKGLRDRRVRLSVSTAIQFYDLQDRLGYDQPSKAVEWLIKAASDSIAELPSLDSKYPDTTNQLSDDEKRVRTSSQAGFELENDPTYHQHICLSKSACSSTSETSKGSVLSLSRSEIRVKARERARERAAKDKDKEQQIDGHQQNSQNSSFTDLLTGGGASNNHSPSSSIQQNHNSPSFFPKQARHSPPTSMDYHFSTGLFGPTSLSRNHHLSSSFSTQPHFGMPAPFNVTNENHPELQQFSFLPDHHLIPEPEPVGGAGNDYNLNFSISSGFAGYNRGTLQSNSSSHLQQRFSSPADQTNMPFFIGGSNAAASNASPADQNQFPAGFDGRLHLYYGDVNRHSDMKGKEKR